MFMDRNEFFSTNYEFHYTISINFYFYLQYFNNNFLISVK